jgi:hypothetical protein
MGLYTFHYACCVTGIIAPSIDYIYNQPLSTCATLDPPTHTILSMQDVENHVKTPRT